MRRSLILMVALTLAWPALAQRQEHVQQSYQDNMLPLGNEARESEAAANFDAIMTPQNKIDLPAKKMARRQYFERNVAPPQPITQTITVAPPAQEPTIQLPLEQLRDLRASLDEIRKRAGQRLGPAVVLGSAEYSGEAIRAALALTLKLQVTLGRPDQWKTVPLVGDDVVLVKANVEGLAIPVSRERGYHVWVTKQTGEATVVVDVLIPARGPRGSIEYDFLVSRTPVTRFSCLFPVAGLEPRLDAAVRSDVSPKEGGTLLSATLRPTNRIHLVGFRDLGEAEGRLAKIYTESMNLLSIDEGSLDLFTVIRYTILYAGAKEFVIQIPPHMSVVSADGEGAFRYVLEQNEKGSLIKGETAFPIHNTYEISLRLHRDFSKKGEAFAVPLPHCRGVERDHGWLGVEVPGKLLLKETRAQEVLPVDVRQLPEEMVRSAVSPILSAYRYHTPAAQVELHASRLPEKEPETGSIDRIKGFTTVTQEGNVMTDMRIVLRNRLRHSLALTVPPGTKVLSTHLDGQKVKPSQSGEGQILVPLKRSSGKDRMEAFTISVVMEGKIGSFGWFGFQDLAMPSVDLPVSSLVWKVYLPARNIYSALKSDIDSQSYAGTGEWSQPARGYSPPPSPEQQGGQAMAEPVTSSFTGAMPVRIKLPEEGIQLAYSRYWLERSHPLEVKFSYARSWLSSPAWMVFALFLALGILLLSQRWAPRPHLMSTWLGGAMVLGALWPLDKAGGSGAVFLGVMMGLCAIAVKRGLFSRGPALVAEWGRTLMARYSEDRKDPLGAGQVVWRVLMAMGLFIVGLILLGQGLQFLFLLLGS